MAHNNDIGLTCLYTPSSTWGWSGKRAGKIAEIVSETRSAYEIRFDDGFKAWVKPSQIQIIY